MFELAPAVAADAAAIDQLLDDCFGPARRLRTAYRLRDGVMPLAGLSLVAHDAGNLVGSIQLWPLRLLHGATTALTLLGPLAVSPVRRSEGIGKALLTEALARADDTAGPPIVLIGDQDYYGAFGFIAAPTQGWAVPGPVDRARLLVRHGNNLPIVGRLTAATEDFRIAA
ncbi:N-acetyltransferase [Sphingosinicellaceae bacterium]|nr:N-acetyltransferase [Sphingosinicellaceae bacterium]